MFKTLGTQMSKQAVSTKRGLTEMKFDLDWIRFGQPNMVASTWSNHQSGDLWRSKIGFLSMYYIYNYIESGIQTSKLRVLSCLLPLALLQPFASQPVSAGFNHRACCITSIFCCNPCRAGRHSTKLNWWMQSTNSGLLTNQQGSTTIQKLRS